MAYRLNEADIDLDKIWSKQDIDEPLALLLKKLAQIVWSHITNPTVSGTNVTQWCKREECWNLLLKRQGIEFEPDGKENEDDEES
jgi:hypothetical protein